jgi:hypothetical protein
MKYSKKILIVLLIVFIGIQFIPVKLNQTDKTRETDIVEIFDVPDNIKSLLQTSCYDCHSNNTNYPWYNNIQPVTWFLINHVEEGKEELNFSEFGKYSKRKQKSKLKSIITQVKKEEMPLWSYTIIHQEAILSQSEKEILQAFFTKKRNNL